MQLILPSSRPPFLLLLTLHYLSSLSGCPWPTCALVPPKYASSARRLFEARRSRDRTRRHSGAQAPHEPEDFNNIYDGPTTSNGADLANVASVIELPESGLCLEVADSLVAEGGKGLFIRLMDGAPPVTVDRATPLCGYAEGSMVASPDSAGGKTVAFHLRSPDTSVFFEGELTTVRQLFASGGLESIAGHVIGRDASSGELDSIRLDVAYSGPRYFVPEQPQPASPTIMQLGQMANDLAIGSNDDEDDDSDGNTSGGRSSYEERSALSNLLVLVQRLERDPDTPSKLLPSRPISTLARTVTFRNTNAMEVGCEYGGRYWGSGV
jgi:hypothetical protein